MQVQPEVCKRLSQSVGIYKLHTSLVASLLGLKIPHEYEYAGSLGSSVGFDIITSPCWVLSVEVASRDYV
jgi:hypothetical protein